MSRSQWRSALIVALRLVITLLFVPAILVKLRNPGAWAHLFTTGGYPSWGPLVISTIEIIGLSAMDSSPRYIGQRRFDRHYGRRCGFRKF